MFTVTDLATGRVPQSVPFAFCPNNLLPEALVSDVAVFKYFPIYRKSLNGPKR
jgi:hypothetical protein